MEDKSVFTYFVDALTEQVLEDLMEVKGYNETQAYNLLYSGGLSIYTTQDPDIQAICDDVFGNEENYPADTKWYLNYALTVKKANQENPQIFLICKYKNIFPLMMAQRTRSHFKSSALHKFRKRLPHIARELQRA